MSHVASTDATLRAILSSLLSPDNGARRAGERALASLKSPPSPDADALVLALLRCLCGGGDARSQLLSAVLLKRVLAEWVPGREGEAWRWDALSAAAQRSVQDGLLAAVEAADMPAAVRRAAVAAAAHAAGIHPALLCTLPPSRAVGKALAAQPGLGCVRGCARS